VAPASVNADAHTNNESTSRVDHERSKRSKMKLWSEQGRVELEKLALAPWTSRRRQELLELLDRIDPNIQESTTAAEQDARKRPEVSRLMTHPAKQQQMQIAKAIQMYFLLLDV